MNTLTAKIPGITCGGCARSIENALKKSGKVRALQVDVEAKTACLDGELTAAELEGILAGIGFEVESVRTDPSFIGGPSSS